jgi:hypothetical protein
MKLKAGPQALVKSGRMNIAKMQKQKAFGTISSMYLVLAADELPALSSR